MRKFNITVNGTAYEVDVEELSAVGTPITSAPASVAAPPSGGGQSAPSAPAPAPVAPKPAAGGKEGANKVNAPIPGTVLSVKVGAGDSISAGQVLLILEAMKMENEIAAPVGGKVVSIHTAQGASVNSGDLLVTIE
jgi:biotin carboxyl carrier protein